MASTDATFENLLLNWQKGITKLTIKASETITLNGKQFVDKESFDAACKYADEIGKKPKITPEELGPVNLTFKEVLRQVEVCAQVLSEMSGQADSSADEIAKLKEMVACRDGEIVNLKTKYENLKKDNLVALSEISRLTEELARERQRKQTPTPEGWPYVWPKVGDLPEQPIWTYPDGYRWVPDNNEIWCSTGSEVADVLLNAFMPKSQSSKKQG
jgi:hypothetical protein